MARYWEIDFLRGTAVILMVLFNYAFALGFLGIYSIDGGWLFWRLFPRLIASAFIGVAGLSAYLMFSKSKDSKKLISRGAKIFCLGLGITAATLFLYPHYAIYFGILHLIGLSVVFSAFLARLDKKYLALLFISTLAAGIFFSGISGSPWLLWLGVVPENFSSFDYFPVMPWISIFILGIVSGKILYKNGRRSFSIRNKPVAARPFCFLGRHSLIIYLLHQPLLLAGLYMAGFSIV